MMVDLLKEYFYNYLWIMIGIAVIVFIALYFVDAGYGQFTSAKWGWSINNRIAWFLMEFPIFLAMILIFLKSEHKFDVVRLVFFGIFEIHYFQRSIIFPLIMKGKRSRMPIAIMMMGITFNLLNSIMQGFWIFFLSSDADYRVKGISYNDLKWLQSPWFLCGLIIWCLGFYVNLRSDYIIRHLRKSDFDTKHYLPKGFMFNYVTSANYLGELMEWLGFAILTWSFSGLVFFIWTFANLVPRANAIHRKYKSEFADEMKQKRLKRVFPFVY